MTSHPNTQAADSSNDFSEENTTQALPAAQKAAGSNLPLVVCQSEFVQQAIDVAPDTMELTSIEALLANPAKAAGRQVIAVGLLEQDRFNFMKEVQETCDRSSALSVASYIPTRDFENEDQYRGMFEAQDFTERRTCAQVLLKSLTRLAPCWPKMQVSNLVAYPVGTGIDSASAPQELLLDPILPHPSLSMIYAKRGVGKTHFALGIAVAVASGSTFLKYKAPKPRSVLYIDGEMPPGDIMRRLRGVPSAQGIPGAYLQVMSASDNRGQLPDLALDDGRDAYTHIMSQFDLIILDNLSSLSTMLKENDGDSWAPIQRWLLGVRGRGKSVLFVHHGGKSGGQRGSSRKEDVLDTVIELAEPPGKTASEGAMFEVHLAKARSCFGEKAGSFKAQLSPDTDTWTVTDIGREYAGNHARVRQLREEGKTMREIAEITNLSKSKVGRISNSDPND
jgi:hypothetical protein